MDFIFFSRFLNSPLDFNLTKYYNLFIMKIKSVIFDLDNTIYNYDYAHEIAFGALCEYAGRMFGVSKDEFRALHRQAMEEQLARTGYECAAIHSRLIRYQIILEYLRQPYDLAPDMLNSYWPVFLQNLRPEPGIRDCLINLKRENYILGVGTNMTADYQYEKLKRLDMARLFDFLVTSEEVNSEKPDAKIFQYCAKKAGFPESQCAFVGDSFAHDITGARNAGMIPIWYCPAFDDHPASGNIGKENAAWTDTKRPNTIPDGVFLLRHFADLPALLRKINI